MVADNGIDRLCGEEVIRLFENVEGRWKTNGPSCKKWWQTMVSIGYVAGLAWSMCM